MFQNASTSFVILIFAKSHQKMRIFFHLIKLLISIRKTNTKNKFVGFILSDRRIENINVVDNMFKVFYREKKITFRKLLKKHVSYGNRSVCCHKDRAECRQGLQNVY